MHVLSADINHHWRVFAFVLYWFHIFQISCFFFLSIASFYDRCPCGVILFHFCIKSSLENLTLTLDKRSGWKERVNYLTSSNEWLAEQWQRRIVFRAKIDRTLWKTLTERPCYIIEVKPTKFPSPQSSQGSVSLSK